MILSSGATPLSSFLCIPISAHLYVELLKHPGEDPGELAALQVVDQRGGPLQAAGRALNGAADEREPALTSE